MFGFEVGELLRQRQFETCVDPHVIQRMTQLFLAQDGSNGGPRRRSGARASKRQARGTSAVTQVERVTARWLRSLSALSTCGNAASDAGT